MYVAESGLQLPTWRTRYTLHRPKGSGSSELRIGQVDWHRRIRFDRSICGDEKEPKVMGELQFIKQGPVWLVPSLKLVCLPSRLGSLRNRCRSGN